METIRDALGNYFSAPKGGATNPTGRPKNNMAISSLIQWSSARRQVYSFKLIYKDSP